MSFKKLAVVALASLILAALPLFAGDAVPAGTATAKVEAAKGPETAIFAIPGLKNEALVKNLNSALAKEAGIMAAKADAENGKFMVTFEPGKTNPETSARPSPRFPPKPSSRRSRARGPGGRQARLLQVPEQVHLRQAQIE